MLLRYRVCLYTIVCVDACVCLCVLPAREVSPCPGRHEDEDGQQDTGQHSGQQQKHKTGAET